jgi:hypothetical protein
VNPQHLPKRAAEELCTPTGTLCRTNLGRDAFHPRPTPFRRDNLTKTETSGCAQKALSLKSPIAHLPIAHFCQCLVLSFALFVFFVVSPVLNSAIRNPQSAIRNPQSAIRNPQSFSPRISAIIRNYRLSIFHPKQLKKLTTN